MKKILVLCMVFILSFSMFACSSQNTDTDADRDQAGTNQEQKPSSDEDQDSEVPDKIIPDGFADSESGNEEGSAAYDFGFTAQKKFGMSQSVAKLKTSDPASQTSALQKQFEQALKQSSLGSFDIAPAEYESYEGEELDQLVYSLAMDNTVDEDSIDAAAMAEAGLYHSSSEDKYHQYTSYISESLSAVSSDKISTALKLIEQNYGIKVKASKIEKAMKSVLEKVKETEYESVLSQKKTIQADSYTETVTVSVEGAMYDDGTVAAYIYVDRDRVYK